MSLKKEEEDQLREILKWWNEKSTENNPRFCYFSHSMDRKGANFSQYIDLRGKSIRIDGLKEGGGFNGSTARTMYGLLALKGVQMIVSDFVSIKEIFAHSLHAGQAHNIQKIDHLETKNETPRLQGLSLKNGFARAFIVHN